MLTGKNILVTGAGSGIGRASCVAMAQAGATVMCADIDEAEARATAGMIEGDGGRAAVCQVDVSSPESVAALFGTVRQTFGRLHGAFNNAGIMGANKSVDEIEVGDWQRLIRIDLDGVFYCMREAISMMAGSGGGAIVNMASVCGVVGIPAAVDYVAAKHGVIGMTKGAACDAAKTGVRVNAILPGTIRTPMVEGALQSPAFADQYQALLDRHPIGRVGEPSEVANAATWLLSDYSSFVNGAALPVDGGYSAR